MNSDGSDFRTYASGLRNAVGMDLDPRTGALWVNNNGMDDLYGSGQQRSDDNPCESIYLVCDGANYGWPWCYAFQLRNPQQPWVNLDTNVVKTFDGPVAEVEAHSAPLGLHFYRGTKFPSIYRNAIFQCYHGSWDRSPPAPPRITIMWADTDGKNARVADFVTGFEVPGAGGDSTKGHYFGRPVSIIEGADSALYVSDDQEGVVYRIAYTGEASNVASSTDEMKLEVGNPVPDPGEQTLTLSISGQQSTAFHFDIFDEAGRNVLSKHIGEVNSSISIDISTLRAGTYTIQVSADGGVATRRFVVER